MVNMTSSSHKDDNDRYSGLSSSLFSSPNACFLPPIAMTNKQNSYFPLEKLHKVVFLVVYAFLWNSIALQRGNKSTMELQTRKKFTTFQPFSALVIIWKRKPCQKKMVEMDTVFCWLLIMLPPDIHALPLLLLLLFIVHITSAPHSLYPFWHYFCFFVLFDAPKDVVILFLAVFICLFPEMNKTSSKESGNDEEESLLVCLFSFSFHLRSLSILQHLWVMSGPQ